MKQEPRIQLKQAPWVSVPVILEERAWGLKRTPAYSNEEWQRKLNEIWSKNGYGENK